MRMRKYFLFAYLVIFCFIAAALSFKYYLVGEVTKQINAFANHLDTRYVQIKYEAVENTCIFSVCAELKNVRIRFVNSYINAGTVLINLPIDYPVKAYIDTKDATDDTDFIIHGIFENDNLSFSKINARLKDFSIDVSGDINMRTGQINMQAATENLGPFILPYMPSHMRGFIRLFFTNGAQLVQISSGQGWLLIQGVPVFPLYSAFSDHANHSAAMPNKPGFEYDPKIGAQTKSNHIPETQTDKPDTNKQKISFE